MAAQLTLLVATLIGCAAYGASIAAPDLQVSSRLVWTTMVAVDNANRTDNYSVVRALGSRDFQQINSTSRLAEIFSNLRANRVDVGRAILMEPTFHIPPTVSSDGILRLRGSFESRPMSLRFDLLFIFEDGGWRLLGVSILETSSSTPR